MSAFEGAGVGDTLPIFLQIIDGNTTQYPQVVVLDNDDTVLTTLDLAHVADGMYKPAVPYIMPDEIFITCFYKIYSDVAHTEVSQNYVGDVDAFIKNEYDPQLEAIQADLDNPDQYKATGFSIPDEYSARLTAIQLDLDTPDQYKATGFAQPNEYDARMAAIQADLDTPDQYKATGFGVAGEYDARMTALQESANRILGLTQENTSIDTTVYAGDNLTSARLRTYSDAASVGTDLNVLATYAIAATYTGAGMQTYSMVKL